MKSYIVGGWVRDRLLGKNPTDKDWVVVGATEKELLARGFERVGASFPVFLHPLTKEEYALARTERKEGRGYHGFVVDFAPHVTLEEDLERRDLTINAIAFEESTQQLFDPFGGQQDLQRKILKHVSKAFAEDPLRLVRLARFAALLPDFAISPETMEYCRWMVSTGELKFLVQERVTLEVIKAHKPNLTPIRFWEVLFETGGLAEVFPGWESIFPVVRSHMQQVSLAGLNDFQCLIVMLLCWHQEAKKHKVAVPKDQLLLPSHHVKTLEILSGVASSSASLEERLWDVIAKTRALHDRSWFLSLWPLVEKILSVDLKIEAILDDLDKLDVSWVQQVFPQETRSTRLKHFYVDHLRVLLG